MDEITIVLFVVEECTDNKHWAEMYWNMFIYKSKKV